MTSRRTVSADARSDMARRSDRRGPPPRPARGGSRISPGVIFLVIALVLSVVYAVYALTVRDTSQIPLLASGAVVVGLAFGAFALYALSAVWRAGMDGRGGKALLLGLIGGGAAMVAAGCLAGAIVLFMLAGSSSTDDAAPAPSALLRVPLLHSAPPAPIV